MINRICLILASLLLLFPLLTSNGYSQESNLPTNELVKYIQINKDKNGKLYNVTTVQAEIPRQIQEWIPKTKDEKLLNRKEINELATKYHLFERTKMNPQLRYKEGDISYWLEQHISSWELSLEFLSRRLVLLVADQHNATIPTQGDLSHWSQQIYTSLYNNAQIKWNK
ncbi:MAG: hypothetical protein WCQ10_07315 [Chitinophagia bacterium]